MHQHKSTFTERFKAPSPLRLRMTLVLLATRLSGLLTTRCLLAAGVESIVIYFPLAGLLSYLVFFCLIKLWLKYLALGHTQLTFPHSQKIEFGPTHRNIFTFQYS
jgi:hypothetical protein